jgi:FtsH-binding integral membrane protein
MNNESLDQTVLEVRSDAASGAFITRTYAWMTFALCITAASAFFTASSQTLLNLILGSRFVFMGLIIGELLLVGALIAAVRRMSPTVATLVFLGYSALNGLTLSVVLLAFTAGSVVLTFLITAGTFAIMSIYGYTTKADLTRIGNLALMALIGVILASLVNMFMQSETLDWIISYLGVAIFVGLIAYDTQKLKDLSYSIDHESSEGKKASLMGALTLYLDFINLFLFLLRLFGRKD